MVAQISRRRTLRADAQAVWDVLADFGSIHDRPTTFTGQYPVRRTLGRLRVGAAV